MKRPPPNETPAERALRKAPELRKALITAGIVVSMEPDREWDTLPEERKINWIKLATEYCKIF